MEGIIAFVTTWLGVILAIGAVILLPVMYRRVVEPNEVHIVQSRKRSKSYGKGQEGGNAYWDWPSWIPIIGIQAIKLPLSNFAIDLKGYAAYDIGRLPFDLDVIAFFRIENASVAAARISSIEELKQQLTSVVQGAVRSILAKEDIEAIMGERAVFGDRFTAEVQPHLQEWGVATVKSIELMDIRDGDEEKTISNIMAKKASQIEMESRKTVAENLQKAQEAEIAAKQAVDTKAQDALEAVGKRTADQEKNVGTQRELSRQAIAEQAATTAEKLMAVKRVEQVKQAEIKREQEVIGADEDRQKVVLKAQGDKESTVAIAEGHKEAKLLEAIGIRAEGEAKANATELMQIAEEVAAQAKLAEVIGTNQEYQTYLINVATVAANRDVGIEQAKALQDARVNVVAQGGTPAEGLTSVMEIFSGKGAQTLSTMAETFFASPTGQELAKKLGFTRHPARTQAAE